MILVAAAIIAATGSGPVDGSCRSIPDNKPILCPEQEFTLSRAMAICNGHPGSGFVIPEHPENFPFAPGWEDCYKIRAWWDTAVRPNLDREQAEKDAQDRAFVRGVTAGSQ